MSYSHIITSNYISVMNLETGTVTKITSDAPIFAKAIELIKQGDFEAVENLSPKNAINKIAGQTRIGDFSVRIANGQVMYSFKGQAEEILHNAMTDRIISLAQSGFDAKPLIAFMTNLLSNPSKTSIDELYLFLESTGLPITSDGHFIAYKIVRSDYKSIHDGKFENNVGTVVEMPRNQVCDNRNQTCSYGLHFCSKTYLNQYGSDVRDTDRLLLVKINPADVVSIPSDYNNAKGRASKYLIWKDITAPGWREEFVSRDYNTSPVEMIDEPAEAENDETEFVHILDSEYDALPIIEVILDPQDGPVCPNCGSVHIQKKGFNRVGDMRRYKCSECGHNFYEVIY